MARKQASRSMKETVGKATRKKAGATKKASFNLARATRAADAQLARVVKEAQAAPMAAAAQQSAFIDYYLLIDFGFTSGQPFQPNSIQFYSNTSGFLCYKLVDNSSLTSLVPILDCDRVKVTWNTSTKEAVHIYGMQTK